MGDHLPPAVLAPADPISLADVEALADHPEGLPAEAEPEGAARVRGWEPTTEQEAAWALAHLGALEREQASVAEQAALYHEQIEAWARDAQKGAAGRARFFAGALEGYLRRRYDADPKLRTIKLPSGTLRVRVPQSATVVVDDPRALMLWLLEDDASEGIPAEDVIKPPPPPDVYVSVLRKYVEAVQASDGTWTVVLPETGVIPPGVRAVPPADPSFTVSPS